MRTTNCVHSCDIMTLGIMSEKDHRPSLERSLGTSAKELVYRYEDGYDAEIHPSFESLSEQFAEYAEGRFAAYNVPVWIDYDHESEAPTVSIGVILTRHGICMIWRSPASSEQFHEVQVRMLNIWAHRADTGFGRFLFRMDRDEGAKEPSG